MAKAILRMAVPLTAAQLINLLYSVVDRMYIGHIPDTGSLALTGIGLCVPITSVVYAFASLAGRGGAPLCSIQRGKGDQEKAEEYMGNSFTLLLLFGAALTVLGLVFKRPILYAFGASDATWPYADEYVTIYLLGNLFIMVTMGMNGFINAQGFALIGMLTILLGAGINLILDPILIFGLNMGIRGAAIATVIAQGCSALWVMLFLTSRRAVLRFRPACLRLRFKTVREICGLGFAGFVMSLTNATVQVEANALLQILGGDLYVGAMTVINTIREVITMAVHGLNGGAEPVLGYNYGAGRYDRVRKGIQFATVASFFYCGLAWAVVTVFDMPIVRFFNDDPALLEVCAHAMRIYYAAFVMMAFQFTGQSTFVALGRAKQAVFFSMLRKVIIVVPLMAVLPHVGGLGTDGVFLSEPISNILGGTACYVTMLLTVWRPLKAMDKTPRA